MVTVYIWKPGRPGSWKFFHFEVGHTSMKIRDEYYSFWPSHDKKFSSVPATFYSYEDDIKKKGFKPDDVITINNLNEGKMIDFWKEVKTNREYYHLLKKNCCIVVGIALREGFMSTERGKQALSRGIHKDLQRLLQATPKGASRYAVDGFLPLTPSVVGYYAELIKDTVD